MPATIDDRDDCADQALVPTDHCHRLECQTWKDDKPVRPLLVLRGKFWCCPSCGHSYGERAKSRN